MQSGLLQLKAKYGLVHVPSPGKARKWAAETRRLLAEGYPEEQAGMEAARRIFRYEYKEYAVYQGLRVNELLDALP
ncbi:MAG: hypothetical protein ACP5IA_10400 [Sediminispirochaetaceae bacterium]